MLATSQATFPLVVVFLSWPFVENGLGDGPENTETLLKVR